MKVISQENRVGTCLICSSKVRDMLLIKGQDKRYFYACLDCLGKGESRKVPVEYIIEIVDEEKLAREKALDILISLAEEDEEKFGDMRLSVVKSFEDEIVEGDLSNRLENYLNFNGNNLSEVLKVRNYALQALLKPLNSKNKELIELYKKARIEKWTLNEKNRIKILMSDKEVQVLDNDNSKVLNDIDLMFEEVHKESSTRKYDNIEDVKKVLNFYEEKLFLTESQLKRLKGFHNEMTRRSSKS